MHRTHAPGKTNHMGGINAVNRPFVPEPTARYNAGIQYNRLIHRRCASLDLENAFKEIKISQNIEKEVCNQCQAEICRCPALCQGRHAHQHHQRLPILVMNRFPTWWQTNHCKNRILSYIHLLMKKRIEKLQRFVEHLNTTG